MAAVYVAATCEAGPVKIGLSVDPDKRLTELQTGCPGKLFLYASYVPERYSASAVERWAHGHFSGHRVCGEWFSVSVEAAIEALEVAEAMLALPPAPKAAPLVRGTGPWSACPRCAAHRERQAARMSRYRRKKVAGEGS